MPYVLRDHCLYKHDCSFAIHICPQHEKQGECGAQRGDTYTEIYCSESLSSAQILSLFLGSQKFRLETCCFFCAEINFLYLHSPLKIQMLVSNCGGCIAPKISNKPTFLNFATPNDWVQHPPLCRAVYTVLIVMTEPVSVFRSFWGPGSLKTCEKHLCDLGWPLAGLTGRAGVEDVSASRGFFRISVLFLGYQTNHCVFIKASFCK